MMSLDYFFLPSRRLRVKQRDRSVRKPYTCILYLIYPQLAISIRINYCFKVLDIGGRMLTI